MGIALCDTVPNYELDTTMGKIKLHDYMGNNWLVFLSFPADFTPVCTTEVAKITQRHAEFEKRGVKVVALSNNTSQEHNQWVKDIESYIQGKESVNYPIAADPERKISMEMNMVERDLMGPDGKPLPNRALHIFGPDKKLKLSFIYPESTGRNFDEVLRVIDSLQLHDKFGVVTPGDWKQGDKVLVPPSLSDDEAQKKLGEITKREVASGKAYMRLAEPPKV